MMNTEFLYSIDNRFKYILTIVSNHRFQYNQSSFNQKILNDFSIKYFIKELNKLRKKVLKENKYILKNNQLKKMKEHFLSIASFEARERTDKLIHFHYIFSSIIELQNKDNPDLILRLEQDTIKSYIDILNHWKNKNIIKEFQLKEYIPYNEFIKEHPDCFGFASYILKEANNPLYPVPFFSDRLNTLINQNYEKTK